MNFLKWREINGYRQVMWLFTIILVVVLASHPELRLIIPLLDALGLDLLLFLMGAQFFNYAREVIRTVYLAFVLPLTKLLYRVVIYFFGFAGPYVDAQVSGCRH